MLQLQFPERLYPKLDIPRTSELLKHQMAANVLVGAFFKMKGFQSDLFNIQHLTNSLLRLAWSAGPVAQQ